MNTYSLPTGSSYDGTIEGFDLAYRLEGGEGEISGTGWLSIPSRNKTSIDLALSMGVRPSSLGA